MQQAYQEQLTALYSQYSAVLIEAEENSIGLTKAQYDLEAAEKKQTDTFNRMNELMEEANAEAQAYSEEYGVWADATTFLTQEYYDLQDSIYDINDEIWTAQDTIDAYTKAIEEDQEAVAAAEEEIALAEEAVQNLTAATQDGGDAATEAAAQEQELQTAITGVKEEINALVTAYTEAYDAALESISGQYQLWDEAAGVVATSAGTINSALESQITYWQDYNANLQTLTERSADIEGLSEMIASFADGSEESVNAIAGMAGATSWRRWSPTGRPCRPSRKRPPAAWPTSRPTSPPPWTSCKPSLPPTSRRWTSARRRQPAARPPSRALYLGRKECCPRCRPPTRGSPRQPLTPSTPSWRSTALPASWRKRPT